MRMPKIDGVAVPAGLSRAAIPDIFAPDWLDALSSG